jgi:sulfonate dioxygenase
MSQTAVSTTASTTMAPVIAVNRVHTSHVPNPDFIPPADYKLPENFQQVTINPKGPTQVPLKTARDYSKEEYKYSDFLPYNTLTSEDPLTPYDHTDASSRADPEKKSLFDAIPSRKDMTPNIGTEVRGVQLSELSNQQRDELALYVAERGLVIFREQDFVDLGIQWLMEFGSYFGRLHTHQFGVHPKNHPELTVVFRDMDKGNYFDNQAGGSLNTLSWHTDM